GDYYFRVREGYAGNPWVISTMWLAQAERVSGFSDGARWLDWVEQRATRTKMLSEQFHPDTGEALSVQPLAWSHGELLETHLT
ncbi:MAG: glycoside hydrolase family 15 protein, partial [Armatimonadota bacterium]